jgi:hypothetical protein
MNQAAPAIVQVIRVEGYLKMCVCGDSFVYETKPFDDKKPLLLTDFPVVL